jgi:hypothetical protein
MRVRIVRKLADRVDGVDLSHCDVGEVIELPEPDGRLIIAERWGVFARRQEDVGSGHEHAVGSASLDRRHTSADLYQRLRDKQEEYERRDRRQVYRRLTDDPFAPPPGAV